MRLLPVPFVLLAFVSNSIAQPVASVNEKPIALEQLRRSVELLQPEQIETIKIHPYPKEHVLSTLIGEELLYQEAAQKGLQNEKDFQDRLKQAERMLLITYFIDKLTTPNITTKNLNTYYKDHIGDYNTTTVNIARITLLTEKDANAFITQLKSGQLFPKLAQEEMKKVDTQYFPTKSLTRRQLTEDLAKQLFASKPGAIVGPRQTDRGWEVIQVQGFTSGSQLPFEDVQNFVAYDYSQYLLRKHIETLKKTAKIEINKDQLQKINWP